MSASASRSLSTVSREDNHVLSSEDSSTPDESDLQLGLALTLGAGAQYARILTAKDFPSSSSSSSSSSSPTKPNHAAKRTADSVAAASQVVGWPPIRASRINSMVNQARSLATQEHKSCDKNKTNNTTDNNGATVKVQSSLFVKVNMDGIPIGRKVDLKAHTCYHTLALSLEDMFHLNSLRSSVNEHDLRVGSKTPSILLDGKSNFVLTYEDKDGDWMLVGDVPWGMFLGSVKRLKIMRTSEATGLAPRLEESNRSQRRKPINHVFS